MLLDRMDEDGVEYTFGSLRERYLSLLMKDDLYFYQRKDSLYLMIYSDKFEPFSNCWLEVKRSTKGNRYVVMHESVHQRLIEEYPKLKRKDEPYLYGQPMK